MDFKVFHDMLGFSKEKGIHGSSRIIVGLVYWTMLFHIGFCLCLGWNHGQVLFEISDSSELRHLDLDSLGFVGLDFWIWIHWVS